MSKVILDAVKQAELTAAGFPCRICDESGRELGTFLPEPIYRAMFDAWCDANIDEHDLQSCLSEPGGRTLAEIWEQLGRK